MREIRRRTRVVGAFPDGRSALMLVVARLLYVAGTHSPVRSHLFVPVNDIYFSLQRHLQPSSADDIYVCIWGERTLRPGRGRCFVLVPTGSLRC